MRGLLPQASRRRRGELSASFCLVFNAVAVQLTSGDSERGS